MGRSKAKMESIKRYLAFVKPYIKEIILTIIIGIVKFGIPLLLPLVMMYVIDDIVLADNLSTAEKKHPSYYG